MSFYRTHPDEQAADWNNPEAPEFIRCDWCELWLIDGQGERIGGLYGHPMCAREHDEILSHGLMAELDHDEKAGK